MPLIWIDDNSWGLDQPATQGQAAPPEGDNKRQAKLAEQWRTWGQNYTFDAVNMTKQDSWSHFAPSASWCHECDGKPEAHARHVPNASVITSPQLSRCADGKAQANLECPNSASSIDQQHH